MSRMAWWRGAPSPTQTTAPVPEPVPQERAPARGHVERLDGLVLQGWAWSAGGEQPRLRCNGELLDAALVRLEREDVRQALGVTELRLGFEFELPSQVWALADAQGSCQLAVELAGQLIGASPQPLLCGGLATLLERSRAEVAAHEAASAADKDDGVPKPLEPAAQYRLLLVLEHLAAAGALAALAPDAQAFARGQAERYGLQSIFDSTEDGPGSGAAPVQDLGDVAVWRLLRLFNDSLDLDDPNALASVLDTVLSRPGVQGEVRQRFLLALLPFFCAADRYDLLRPRLDGHRLRSLASGSESAWELSLALPEMVASGDGRAAVAVLRRLASAPGWINFECVVEAVRQWCRQGLPATPDLADDSLPEAFQAVLWAQAASAWNRLHDRHLMRALAELLAHRLQLPPAQQVALERAALTHYGLVPDFWVQLSAAQPDVARWPLALRDMQRRLQTLQVRLDEGRPLALDEALGLAALLAVPAAAYNADAGFVLRELLQAAMGRPASAAHKQAALAALAALSPAEPLRLVAHPLADRAWLDGCADLPDLIRAASSLPTPLAQAAWRAVQQARAAGRAPSGEDLTLLADRRHLYVGTRLAVQDWVSRRSCMDDADAQLTAVRELWVRGWSETAGHSVPPEALLGAWRQLVDEQQRQASPALASLVDELGHCLRGRWAVATAAAQRGSSMPLQLVVPASANGLLVAIYSCQRNLDTRVRRIRETWARDLTARGIRWVVVVGDPQARGLGELDGDILRLPVPDAYEDLPAKTLALLRWTVGCSDAGHLLKIDDDCHLAVDAFLALPTWLAHHYLGRRLHRGPGGTDRRWHQARSATVLAAGSIDKSPEPSTYADGGSGYVLSRTAMARVLDVLDTDAGARLTRSAFMEDKLLGDLLALAGFALSSDGHQALVRRRFGADPVPVNAFQNLFLPGPNSPTTISHLDDAEALPAVQAGLSDPTLRPARLWSTWQAPSLALDDSNQLELLSPTARVRALADAPVIVVAVARNEGLLLPHFLAHYRALGVRHFVLVDNLSDDGSRAWLMQQDDVVLYSADTQYRHSHYGVAWQQAVLAAHALGKWAVLADIDEFLVYPDCEVMNLPDWLAACQAEGADAVTTLMVDMYPAAGLEGADFLRQAPFEAAPHFDRQPLLRWRLGSGCYSNAPTWLSALRHRMIPDSAPNLYTSQKIAVLRYQPWVRLSEGLHYASNLRVSARRAGFAHFKYHAGFREKVLLEVARKQHFNGAEEYRRYLAMLAEASQPLMPAGGAATWQGSASFSALTGAA